MNNLIIHTIVVPLLSLIGTAYLVPKISSIVKFKRLMDDPNERSSHSVSTPSLGGIAFYIILVLSFYFNSTYDTYDVAMSLIPGLTILLFLGLKDDLVVLSPRTKLAGQVIAAYFMLAHSKFEINTLHGFFGIHEIPFLAGIALGMFIMLAVINSFNLIDGIDGLAASVGIVAFSGFAVVFCMMDKYFLGLVALTLVGILAGFLFFNLSSSRKIFMGDTGSMILGFMLGMFAVRFLAMDDLSLNKLHFNPVNVPIVIVSFLIIPLFDTLRVVTIRLLNKKGPFSPDRNHLHHVLIDAYGISHRRASFFIANTNIACVVIIAALIKFTNIVVSVAVIMLILLTFTYYLNDLKKRRLPEINKRLKAVRQMGIERKMRAGFPAEEVTARTNVNA